MKHKLMPSKDNLRPTWKISNGSDTLYIVSEPQLTLEQLKKLISKTQKMYSLDDVSFIPSVHANREKGVDLLSWYDAV